MPATYEPIATTTLGSAATNITFSSIPATYTDLRLVLVARSDRAINSIDSVYFQVNSNTATNYSNTLLYGDGSVQSYRESSASQILAASIPASGATSGIFGLLIIDIFSYAGSTNKTFLCDSSGDSNGSGRTQRAVALWRNTAAITSTKVYPAFGTNFITGTTATLYGIKAA